MQAPSFDRGKFIYDGHSFYFIIFFSWEPVINLFCNNLLWIIFPAINCTFRPEITTSCFKHTGEIIFIFERNLEEKLRFWHTDQRVYIFFKGKCHEIFFISDYFIKQFPPGPIWGFCGRVQNLSTKFRNLLPR